MSVRNYPDVPRIYVDMDLPLINGAKEGIAHLLSLGFFVMCLTKIPSENPSAASDKILWLNEHFPSLNDYVIISPDKGCVGTTRDFLIDDHPEWANAHNFPGTVVHFASGKFPNNWRDVCFYFSEIQPING
jgi:5'-nucleotidase